MFGSFLIWVSVIFTGLNNDNVNWENASIVMSDGEVLIKQIRILDDHEAIVVRQGRGQAIIPVHKIIRLQYYDQASDRNHAYEVFRVKERGITHHKLFEIAKNGKVRILSKNKPNLIYRPEILSKGSRVWVRQASGDLMATDYYVFMNGKVISLEKFKSDILPTLLIEYPPLEHLIKNNNFDLDILGHRTIVIMHYNLMQEDRQVAFSK